MAETVKIEGLDELTRKLEVLGAKTGINTMRKAVRRAAVPVRRQMVSRAPVGSRSHKSYKNGRLLPFGFLKRSIKIVTLIEKSRGSAAALIGVRSEAFYGITFLDQGPFLVTARRVIKGRGGPANTRKKVGKIKPYMAAARTIKPYVLRKKSWFEFVFRANRRRMDAAVAQELKMEIDRVTK